MEKVILLAKQQIVMDMLKSPDLRVVANGNLQLIKAGTEKIIGNKALQKLSGEMPSSSKTAMVVEREVVMILIKRSP